jgi:hypothetical protein
MPLHNCIRNFLLIGCLVGGTACGTRDSGASGGKATGNSPEGAAPAALLGSTGFRSSVSLHTDAPQRVKPGDAVRISGDVTPRRNPPAPYVVHATVTRPDATTVFDGDIETDASGHYVLDFVVDQWGYFTASVRFGDGYPEFRPSESDTIIFVPFPVGMAIVLTGPRGTPTAPMWDYIADMAVLTLWNRGIPDLIDGTTNHIRYLSEDLPRDINGDGIPDVDAPSSTSTIKHRHLGKRAGANDRT